MQNDFDKEKCRLKHVGPYFIRIKAFEVEQKGGQILVNTLLKGFTQHKT
jgi:hypothetical protein